MGKRVTYEEVIIEHEIPIVDCSQKDIVLNRVYNKVKYSTITNLTLIARKSNSNAC